MRLTIADKEFDLKKFTLRDWVKLEERGLSMKALNKGEYGFKDIANIAVVALCKADPDITEDWVLDNLDLDNVEVMESIANFISPKGSSTPAPSSST